MGALAGPIETAQGVIDTFVNAVKGFWDWISGKTFEFKFSLPDLPEWAIPGSPLPIHTAWENFADDMNRMRIEPQMMMTDSLLSPNMVGAGAGIGGGTTSATTINIDARGAGSGVAEDLEGMIRRILNEQGQAADAIIRTRR
jgi:hypothetical protein